MDNLPTSVPQEALPDQDFIERVNRIERSQKVIESPTIPSDDVILVDTPSGKVPLSRKAVEPTAEKIVEQITKKEPKEIKLFYKYFGDCSEHLIPVVTLDAVVNGKLVIFAFCELCRKNVMSQVVPQLDSFYDDKSIKEPVKRTFTRKKV